MSGERRLRAADQGILIGLLIDTSLAIVAAMGPLVSANDLGFAASYATATGYFWPDIPSFTQPGRWTFKLTAADEAGCFIVEL